MSISTSSYVDFTHRHIEYPKHFIQIMWFLIWCMCSFYPCSKAAALHNCIRSWASKTQSSQQLINPCAVVESIVNSVNHRHANLVDWVRRRWYSPWRYRTSDLTLIKQGANSFCIRIIHILQSKPPCDSKATSALDKFCTGGARCSYGTLRPQPKVDKDSEDTFLRTPGQFAHWVSTRPGHSTCSKGVRSVAARSLRYHSLVSIIYAEHALQFAWCPGCPKIGSGTLSVMT